MRSPIYDISVFKERRARMAEKIKGAALIIPAHPDLVRNNDCYFAYRQDTNLLYFTGYEEPGAVLVFRPGMKPETTMFVLPKDPAKETWDGFRFGADAAKEVYGFDQCYTTDDLSRELPRLLEDVSEVYCSLFWNKDFDRLLLNTLEDLRVKHSRGNAGHLAVKDPRGLIGEIRIRKTAFDIEQMRTACRISGEAHEEVRKAARPGVNERELHGVFLKAIMERGCPREGYNSIVAGGANACTLHYGFNDQIIEDGQLVLVDAGAEWKYYSGDITRTFPVSGKFTSVQKRLYDSLLAIQKRAVEMVKPGISRDDIQKQVISEMVDLMLEEKLLKGDKNQLIEDKSYTKYYMHGIGHWLGMDVHDAGLTHIKGEPRPLEAGFCLTIEPGLYIGLNEEEAPAELRGIGIRIEDDILVTADGYENLTANCPKEY